MSNIEQTLVEIRRRDSMYPTSELTAGAVKDRRTLLHIIDQVEGFRDSLKNSSYYPGDETTAYAVEALTSILNGEYMS